MHTVSERRTQVPVTGLHENDILGSWLQVWISIILGSWIRILIRMESWIRIHNRGMEVKMEPWRVCRSVVADSHHLDEEQDPDPHMHESEKRDLQ